MKPLPVLKYDHNLLDVVTKISVLLKKVPGAYCDNIICWYIDNYEIQLNLDNKELGFIIDICNFNIDDTIWYALHGIASVHGYTTAEYQKSV